MYISDKDLAARFGVCRPTIWKWQKDLPDFPPAYRLSPGCTRWKLADIEAWEAARACAA